MAEEIVPPIEPEIVVTEEVAAKYEGRNKGRIPTAIAKQVVAINRAKRISKVQKISPFKETKYGVVQKQKLDMFLEEFMKNGGNATEAAFRVWNCTTTQSAGQMGHRALKQAKGLARVYLEKKGYGYGKLLDVATKKLEESKTPDWWDRLMKIAEYEDFISKKASAPNIVNVIQAHKDFASNYVDGEIEEVDAAAEEEEKNEN